MFTVEDGGAGTANYTVYHGTAAARPIRVDLYLQHSTSSGFSRLYPRDATSGEVSHFNGTAPLQVTHHYHGELDWSLGERHFAVSPASGTIGYSRLVITPLGFQTG